MGKEALSSAFSEMILEEAKKDKDIVVVCTDSRGSAKLGAYPDEVPEQFVEMGIAEQNSVTVSAGMAYMGKKVFHHRSGKFLQHAFCRAGKSRCCLFS